MRSGLLVVLLATLASPLFAASTFNDDSCDIAVAPAATLLLPHFEVDLSERPGEGRTTVFNIINVSPYPQITRVTVWTDWSFPLFAFSIFLTGYDVQAIDMRDVILRGAVPSSSTTPGPISLPNFSNPNHAATMSNDCSRRMPYMPARVIAEMRNALTVGRFSDAFPSCPAGEDGPPQIGSNHGATKAFGFATIDVVSTCSPTLPNQAEYYKNDLLYDNVLIGDWISLDPKGEKNGHATASPMVHIRAVPEGGTAGTNVATRLPHTFYGRFKPAVSDRRQPLPTTFAARFIEGGPTGFHTQLTVWREGATGAEAVCSNYKMNAARPFTEIVRFDERENATIHKQLPATAHLASTSKLSSSSPVFPARTSEDNGGWFFINLADSGRATQNWVEVTLFAEGRFGVQYPAAAMGNGCSAAVPAGAKISPSR